jgi:hypothetical protein
MDSPIQIRIAEALHELAEMPNLSLRTAPKKHGIPRSTLARRLGGGISKKIELVNHNSSSLLNKRIY